MNLRAWFFNNKGKKVELLLRRNREGDRPWNEIGVIADAHEDFVVLEKGGRGNCIPYSSIDRFRVADE